MKPNAKKPEVRRQELINIATELFLEKGYSAVSVRDVLDGVDGANRAQGMFYYYFKSKQDIYIQAMEQYLENAVNEKFAVLESLEYNFNEKQSKLREISEVSFREYLNVFKSNEKYDVENAAHRTRLFIEMINKMKKKYMQFLLQGLKEGCISEESGLSEENIEIYATFTMYGIWGVLYNDILSGKTEEAKYCFADLEPILAAIYFD